MKTKKGFTLVELLAVIVILAIVMLIAVTSVGPMMEKSRKNSLGDEGIAAIKAAETVNQVEINKGASADYKSNESVCYSLDYLCDNGYYEKGCTNSKDGYAGSVLVSYLGDGKKDYQVWITNGTYAYGGVTKENANETYAVNYDETFKDKITSCSSEFTTIPDTNSGTIHIYCTHDGCGKKCFYSGELTPGAEYINGQYTYRYKQEYSLNGWTQMTSDGWGVMFNDSSSGNDINTKLCSSINDKPITSMSYMFNNNRLTKLNLSDFNTSTVTNMEGMFQGIQATELDLSNFDTSNVTNMSQMFAGTQLETIDLSSFNTTNVTNMSRMFMASYNIKTIYAGNKWNTTNVNDSAGMFLWTYYIVGEKGTTWGGSGASDKTYAKIDDPEHGNPGYFTYKAN